MCRCVCSNAPFPEFSLQPLTPLRTSWVRFDLEEKSMGELLVKITLKQKKLQSEMMT